MQTGQNHILKKYATNENKKCMFDVDINCGVCIKCKNM